LPTAAEGAGISFSSDGASLAIATNDISPYITAYPWSSGFGTKYANAATLPTGNARGVAFSPL
jgi:hypothetical protein